MKTVDITKSDFSFYNICHRDVLVGMQVMLAFQLTLDYGLFRPYQMLLGPLHLLRLGALTDCHVIMKDCPALGRGGRAQKEVHPQATDSAFISCLVWRSCCWQPPVLARTLYVNNMNPPWNPHRAWPEVKPTQSHEMETRCPDFIHIQTYCSQCFLGKQIPQCQFGACVRQIGVFFTGKGGLYDKDVDQTEILQMHFYCR